MSADAVAADTLVVDNLVRFPVERRARPTLALMRELAPDARDVRDIVDTFHLTDPALPARERAEADVAGCLRDPDPGATEAVIVVLSGVLNPLVAAAVGVCWTALDAFAASVEARQRLSRAHASGEGWRIQLCARAEAANQEWARSLLDAHARVERAEGVARAIDAALLGPPWPDPTQPDPIAATPSRAKLLFRP